MSEFEAGIYIITPVIADTKQGLGIGPVPLIYPPIDVPVRILPIQLIDRWVIRPSGENNTFTVFAGRGRPEDYKWIVNNDDLFVSATNDKPVGFRFESAGDGLWVISLFGQDAALTADTAAFPALTFRPANGSDAQRFKVVRVDRD